MSDVVIPDGWQQVKLGDVVNFINGDRGKTYPSQSDFVESGIPFISAVALNGKSIDIDKLSYISQSAFNKINNGKVMRNDLLFCLRGSLGKVGLVSGITTGAIASSLVIIRPKPEVLFRYIYFLLSGQTGQSIAKELDNGSVQGNLSVRELRQVSILLPPLHEQKAIAHILGSLDDKIDQLRKTNSVLEEMASALFKSWFVDFDPVKAKQENRPTGLPKDLDDLFPDSFEDSALGPIPTGWRVGCVGDVAINVQKSISSKNLTSDMNYVALEHMPRKSLQLHDWGNAGEVASNKSSFQAGDILFGKLRPYFHKVVIAPVDGVCSTDILVTRPAESDWHGFVTMHMFSDELVKYSDSTSNGTRMPRTSWSVIKGFTISVPPKSIAGQFNMMVDPSWKRASSNIHQIRTLTNLRDTLLPKLILGDLRVPEAEQMVAELGL